MNLRKALVGLAGILTVFCIGFALCQLRAARTETAELTERNRQHDADAQRLAQLEKAEQSAAAQAAQAEAKPNPTPIAAAGPTGAGGSAKSAAAARRAAAQAYAQAFLGKYPEARGMLTDYMTRNMQNYYAPFFHAAGLSQAQIDEFIAQTAQLHLDTLLLNADGSWSPGQQNLSDDAARSILGDAAFQQWKNALLALPAETFAAGMSVSIKNGAAPLSSDQLTAITQIVATNSPDYSDGKPVKLGAVDWPEALQQVQGQMTPEQWQQAQTYLMFQSANQRLASLIRGAK
jgi:hypothetical protein